MTTQLGVSQHGLRKRASTVALEEYEEPRKRACGLTADIQAQGSGTYPQELANVEAWRARVKEAPKGYRVEKSKRLVLQQDKQHCCACEEFKRHRKDGICKCGHELCAECHIKTEMHIAEQEALDLHLTTTR